MSEKEESIDQPEEESEDQPISPEGEEVDQPEEESYFEINGEKVSQDELIKGYMRGADYTRKTQMLSKRQAELEATAKGAAEKPKKDLTEEEKNVLEFLKRNGVVTKDELDQHFKAQNAAQADLQSFNAWRSKENPDPVIAEGVYNLGKTYRDKSYKEIYDQFFKGAVKKVVGKKVVGIKSKKSSTVDTGSISRKQIQEWIDTGKYQENKAKIEKAMAEGKITQ